MGGEKLKWQVTWNDNEEKSDEQRDVHHHFREGFLRISGTDYFLGE
jgi:hypothetical protein